MVFMARMEENKMVVTSNRWNLIKPDLLKIAKGAGIAAAGAIATYILGMLSSLDVGTYTPAIVAILSVVCNAILKFVTVNKY